MWIDKARHDVQRVVWDDVCNYVWNGAWCGAWNSVGNDMLFGVWIPLNKEVKNYVEV